MQDNRSQNICQELFFQTAEERRTAKFLGIKFSEKPVFSKKSGFLNTRKLQKLLVFSGIRQFFIAFFRFILQFIQS